MSTRRRPILQCRKCRRRPVLRRDAAAQWYRVVNADDAASDYAVNDDDTTNDNAAQRKYAAVNDGIVQS